MKKQLDLPRATGINMSKRSPLFWIIVIVLFVLACFAYSCARFRAHGDDDYRAMTARTPLVLESGRVTPIAAADTLAVPGAESVAGTLTTQSTLTSSLSGTPGCGVGEACFFWSPATGTGQMSSMVPAAASPASDDILFRMHYFASARTTEALTIFSQITGTFDTTAGQGFAEAAEFDTTVSRSAGANPLVVVGVGATATGGVGAGNNIAFDAFHGVFKNIDDGNSFAATTITDGLTVDAITNSGTGTNTLSWSGTVNIGQSGVVTIGTNTASTLDLKSTDIENFNVATAATGPYVQIKSTAAGGRTYEVVSSATGDYWGTAAMELVDNSATACSTLGCDLIQIPTSDNAVHVYSDLVLGSTTLNGLTAGHLRALGTSASVACNGTGSPGIILATDTAGRFTTGTGSTQCTITFNGKTFTTVPSCTANIEGATPLAIAPAPTATTLVLSFASLSSGVIAYHCIGLS
jgi:hypothetical protein